MTILLRVIDFVFFKRHGDAVKANHHAESYVDSETVLQAIFYTARSTAQ